MSRACSCNEQSTADHPGQNPGRKRRWMGAAEAGAPVLEAETETETAVEGSSWRMWEKARAAEVEKQSVNVKRDAEEAYSAFSASQTPTNQRPAIVTFFAASQSGLAVSRSSRDHHYHQLPASSSNGAREDPRPSLTKQPPRPPTAHRRPNRCSPWPWLARRRNTQP